MRTGSPRLPLSRGVLRTLRRVPRPPRLNVPGGIYHVTARGNRRQPIFLGEDDPRHFLRIFGAVAARYAWRCHAYCLLPNHYHLVIEIAEADLSVGMHRLNSGFAHWFNDCHGFDGHLFQSRFHAVLVESDWHLLELSRYLALNPVRAGLSSKPSAWPWSSYRAVVGVGKRPPFLAVEHVLSYFGREPVSARRAFRRFVLDGLRLKPAAI